MKMDNPDDIIYEYDENGNIIYFEWRENGKMIYKHHRDEQGLLHNENAPAQLWDNGSYAYYHHGLLHNENGPALYCADGSGVHHYFYNDHPIIFFPKLTLRIKRFFARMKEQRQKQ